MTTRTASGGARATMYSSAERGDVGWLRAGSGPGYSHCVARITNPLNSQRSTVTGSGLRLGGSG